MTAPLPCLWDIFWELDEELERRRAQFPRRVAKGLLSRDDAAHALRVWAALWNRFAFVDRRTPTTNIATEAEQRAAVDRLIADRRDAYPRLIDAGRLVPATAARKLAVLEGIAAWLRQFPAEPIAQAA